MKRILGMALILLIISLTGYSQNNYSLSGRVVDYIGRSVHAGSVKLLSIKDSTLIKDSNINDGNFSFGSIKEGDYFLKISCLGFYEEQMTLKLNEDKNLVISLKENLIALNEVQISGSKNIFSNKNGNIKINIENSIFSKIPNSVDLLTKLPTIRLSTDGENLTIIGRGEPLIYLDNQRIKMNDLNSLPTDDVKTIELINNPSAKYEAEGRSVILITRKKNKTEGIKIDLTETASFKRFFNNRNGLNVSFKKNRVEFKGNLQYNYLNLWESNSNDFRIENKNITSEYILKSIGTRKQTIIGGGIYCQINDDDYFSMNISKRFQNGNFTILTNSYIKQPSVEDNILTHNFNNSGRPFFSSNLNYSKKFKKLNGLLFLGGQYSELTHDLNSNIWNNYNNQETILSQDRKQNYLIDLISGRADFEKYFKNEIKWEIGTSITAAKSNSILNIENYDPKNSSGSNYDYSEKNYAVYTQYSGKIKKVSYSAGLRMENTRVHGGLKDSVSLLVNKDYTSLFPKANVNIPIGSSKTLTFEYAKSINRPNYSTSSQITTYINPFFEWSHNTNINPTIKEEVSASIQYKENTLRLNYYRIKNPVYYGIEYNDQINRLRMIDKNYELESGINLNITIPLKYRFWNSTNVFTVTQNQVKDQTAIFNKSMPYLYVYSNNQFKSSNDYTFIVSVWGITKRNEGIFERNAMYALDVGISKTFYKKLSCTLSYNSIFSTMEAKENFTINNVISNGISYSDVREFSIGMKYSFGKIKDSKYKNKEVDDNINRIK